MFACLFYTIARTLVRGHDKSVRRSPTLEERRTGVPAKTEENLPSMQNTGEPEGGSSVLRVGSGTHTTHLQTWGPDGLQGPLSVVGSPHSIKRLSLFRCL